MDISGGCPLLAPGGAEARISTAMRAGPLEEETECRVRDCADAESEAGSDWWPVEPNDLAAQLGVSPKSLRALAPPHLSPLLR